MHIFEIRIQHILNSGLNRKTASHTEDSSFKIFLFLFTYQTLRTDPEYFEKLNILPEKLKFLPEITLWQANKTNIHGPTPVSRLDPCIANSVTWMTNASLTL